MAAIKKIEAAPIESYAPEDRAFYAFWYGHMLNDLMQPPLANVAHSDARYIWDEALASNAAEVQGLREECERTARNRDMWEGQCERQAEQLTKMRSEMRRFLPLLERVAEGPFWDELTAGLGIATINAYRAALTNQQPE